jgi:hypothetical protein
MLLKNQGASGLTIIAVSTKKDPPRSRLKKPGYELEKGGFSASAGPHNTDEFFFFDMEGDIL